MKYQSKQSRELSKRMNNAVYKSHERLLDNALNQRKEETDPSKLRERYPNFTDHQIARMARLNEKINAANDFLIDEQYYWLNPKERPQGGIEYRADLFDNNNDYEQDKEELQIINDQQEI